MAETRKRRLANGLLIEQNQVLQELQVQPDWKKACDSVGVSHASFRRWIREDTAFKEAYDFMHEGVIEGVRAQLAATAQKAAEVFDEALDATKDVTLEFKCPHCQKDVKIEAEIPDHSTRMRAGEVALKVSKILKDVKEVGGNITVSQLPLHLQIALAAYRREGADAIPPGAYQQLVEAGMIKQLPSKTHEAEYRIVEDEDEANSAD